LPHAASVGVVQWPVASQQPEAHEAASQVHTPWKHACPGAHAEQTAPPLPQAASVGVATHWPLPSQQPPGHDAGPHALPASAAPPPSGAAATPPEPEPELEAEPAPEPEPGPEAPAPAEPPVWVFDPPEHAATSTIATTSERMIRLAWRP
jgi:hypothetical protein